MGIGVVTLSIAPNKNNKIQESAKVASYHVTAVPTGSDDISMISQAATPTVTAIPTIALTPTPTPTPLPVHDLEEGNSDINKLINNYYKAKLACNVDKLKALLSDPTNVSSNKQLKKDIQYIEEYKNIKCYVKKGYQDGTYIVYVYNEVKFVNIKTPAPAADQFYLVTDKDGSLKIFSGKFNEETAAYYKSRIQDTDVIDFIKEVNKKAEQAKKKDKDLKKFWDNLDKKQASAAKNKN